MLDKELKAKWIAALRSGDYPQYTGGTLRNTDEDGTTFCCLAVLNEIDVNTPKIRSTSELTAHYQLGTEVGQELVWKNDRYHWSFPEIADFIEQHKDI